MPLTRYQIRNEYGLADPELYRAADKDDPEALLEGVAMAGLVGVLRQLGDLAEFAAEIFHDLHEEVMSTATRGHGLMVRVQQLEADFPTVEKALLSQTNHSSFYSDTGVDWHPNLHSEQNVITHGDLPRFVLDSYEESRGPPRLFLLDKFDGAGAGACLKRYTDPAFFKAQSAFSLASEDIQKERKIRRVKHKKGSRWRNGETPEVLLPSHSKLHELFLEERISNGYSDPARRVKLKKRHLNGSAVDSRTRKSYMDKFLDTHSPECKLICATSVTSLPLKSSSDNDNESELRIIDISIVSPAELSPEQGSASYLTNKQEVISNHLRDISNGGSFDGDIAKGSEPNSDGGSVNSYSNLQMVVVENELEVGVDDKTEGSVEGYSSDNLPGDVDNFVDALANMESELDTDNESRAKSNESELVIQMKGDSCRIVSDANEEEHLERQAQSLDSQSNENSVSDDWNNSSERERASLNSDSPSNKSDAAGKELPSTESSGSEGTCNEDGMAADRGNISCNRLVREMSPTREHPDHGANSPLASYVEPLLDESSSDKENGTSMDHFMVVASNDSSRAMDEIISSSPALSPVEADDATLCATSEDLPHLKNVEELSSVNQSGNDSENYVCQAKSADEDTVGSFTSAKTDSSHLSPPIEEQLLPAAMDDVQTSSGSTVWSHSSDVAKPVKRVSQANDPVKPSAFKSGVIPWRRISRESYPEEDASQTPVLKKQKDDPQTSVLIDQQICDLDEDTTHSKEKFSIEERSGTLDEEEVGLTTCNDDSEGGDSAYEEIPSNLPAYSGDGDHLLSADMESAIVHVEDVTVPFAAIVKSDDINDFIGTSPGTTSVEAEEDVAALSAAVVKSDDINDSIGTSLVTTNVDAEEDVAVPSAAVVKSDDINDFIDASSGTTSVDAEEGDSVSLELPSNSRTDSGIGNLVISDSMVPETVLREELAVFSASVAESEDVIDINTSPDALCLPPSNFMHLHESLPDSRDPHPKESEMDGVAPPKPVSDSEMQTEVTDVVLLEPESDPSIPVAYDPSILEVNDDEHNFSLDEQNELGATVCDAPTTLTYLESSNQESQSETLDQNCGEYHVSSSTSALPEVELQEAETKLETLQELQANEVQMEKWESDGVRDQLEGAALERSPEFYSGHLGMEDSKDSECSTNSLHSQQTGFPSQSHRELSNLPSTGHIIQATCFDASSVFLPENAPSQPSTSKFFTESVSPETDILKQKAEPLESIFPNFILPSVVHLEEAPPLPPLPPMQWRLGKMQHPSPASHGDPDGVSNGLIFPMQSLKATEKAQLDLPAPQRELLQHQNPFFSFTSEENVKSEPIFEPSVGHGVSPAPYPQVPLDNDSSHPCSFLDLGGMQFSSPSISNVSGDKSGQNDIILEGEKGLSSLEPFLVPSCESKLSTQDPVFSHGEIVHPNQLMPQSPGTSLELDVLEQSFNGFELEQARTLATSVTAPTMEDEQPLRSLPTTEGEQVQCSSKPLILPETECSTSKGDMSYSHEETIQPPQHTQDSGLQPEEREQEKPHDTTVTTTSMIDEKPAYSLSTSDGKTSWSSNTSDVIPDSEVGKSDGTINKIPRPRNPLIDAVTAHGQSKLKKASERIQPEIEPKVDERDLFLHQIRTKSFNLKPATVTRSTPRPNIQGHNPNLKVISLLEKKAIAIRQAFAGSDEDDDDSWSE